MVAKPFGLKRKAGMFYVYLIGGIIIGLGVLVALFAFIMHTIGSGMDPNHVFVCRMRLNQRAEKVFALLADAEGWKSWDPGVTRVETLPPVDGKPACRMTIGRNAMNLVTTRHEPPRVLERTIQDTGARPMFSGSWLHEIASDGDGCVITLTERGVIHVPLARAMARKLADPAMYLKRHFKQLAKHFGEEAVISEDVKK
jgi:hypothetical protein